METSNQGKSIQETLQENELAEIPDEIIHDLLSRLPVKSLFRFKCVSTSWKILISNPKFTLKTNLYRAIFWSKTSPFLYSVNQDLLAEKILNPLAEIPDSPNQNQLVLGSCNGLLLFSISAAIYLWNPSTRSCKEVLQLNLLKEDYIVVASGICFDEFTDDYKIVILLSRLTGGRNILLASLRSKEWTEINFPYTMFSAKSGPVVNGNVHWIIREEKGDGDLIVYFDSRINTFVKLPMPDYNVGDSTDIFRLGVLDECLSLSRFGNIWNPEHVTEVLIMKEYGVKESWTTLCCIPMKGPRTWLPPLFYTKRSRDEVLITNGACVMVFNLKNKSMMDSGLSNKSHNCYMYVESLATVPGQLLDRSLGENPDDEGMEIPAET